MSNKKENHTKSSSSEVYHKHSPWLWVPSLYFAEGLPYAIVLLQSIAMYSMLNLSNTEIAFYTGWLYLPWVIKPIWGPLVDVFFRKRACIISMQLFIGGACAGVALLLPTSWQIQGTLALFWLIAFASATHDIASHPPSHKSMLCENPAYFAHLNEIHLESCAFPSRIRENRYQQETKQ